MIIEMSDKPWRCMKFFPIHYSLARNRQPEKISRIKPIKIALGVDCSWIFITTKPPTFIFTTDNHRRNRTCTIWQHHPKPDEVTSLTSIPFLWFSFPQVVRREKLRLGWWLAYSSVRVFLVLRGWYMYILNRTRMRSIPCVSHHIFKLSFVL